MSPRWAARCSACFRTVRPIAAGSELSDDDVLAYATRSHALVARGLTKKLRIELGIIQ